MQIRDIMLTGIFAGMISVSSQFYLPIGPVPITLQTFFILLSGIILGARLGFASVAVWILLGIAGLPVFTAGKAGLGVLIGPTGGFVFGFLASSYLIGYLVEKNKASYKNMLIAALVGLTIIYIVGVLGFMFVFRYMLNKAMSLEQAIVVAALPFLPLDLIKAAAAGYVGMKVRRALINVGIVKSGCQSMDSKMN